GAIYRAALRSVRWVLEGLILRTKTIPTLRAGLIAYFRVSTDRQGKSGPGPRGTARERRVQGTHKLLNIGNLFVKFAPIYFSGPREFVADAGSRCLARARWL